MSAALEAADSESRSSEPVPPVHLLLVEDNPADVFFLVDALEDRYPKRYATAAAATLAEAKSLLARQEFDVALLDLSLPDSRGLETIEKLAALAPDLPIVVLTGIADERIVPEVVRCGAEDYLLKGESDAAAIARVIHYAIDRKRIEGELRTQRQELEQKNRQLQEAQNRLEAYRDRYVDLYDFAPLGYATLDKDGFVQEINLAGAQLLNVDRAAITGYPFSEYVTEQDMPVFLEMVREVRGRALRCDLRIAADGTRRPLDYGATSQCSHQGSLRGDRRRGHVLQDGDYRHHRSQRDGGGDSAVPRLPTDGDRRDARSHVGDRPRLSRRFGESFSAGSGRRGGDRVRLSTVLSGRLSQRREGRGRVRPMPSATHDREQGAGERGARPSRRRGPREVLRNQCRSGFRWEGGSHSYYRDLPRRHRASARRKRLPAIATCCAR